MTSAADIAVRKFHASLNTSNLEKSIGFYRVLLGIEPAKQQSDYAKFELKDPPLVLSLIPSRSGSGGNLNHVGLRVTSSEELVDIQRRVEAAGFSTTREDGVECCYARQTKFWISDPDRVLWEIYVFHEDLDDHGEGTVPQQALKDVLAEPAGPSRKIWEHRIPAEFPLPIPHADNSLDEVNLAGTMNLKGSPQRLYPILQDAFRALRPGGSIRVHGLAGDRPLTSPLPPLPGPAAVVEDVPSTVEIIGALVEAGFTEVQVEKLSRTAHFTIAGVGMRELMAVGKKQGYRPKTATWDAVYLGPLARVTDDFGNQFPRGVRVPLNVHDWQVLSKGAVANQFQFFPIAALPLSQDSCCGGQGNDVPVQAVQSL